MTVLALLALGALVVAGRQPSRWPGQPVGHRPQALDGPPRSRRSLARLRAAVPSSGSSRVLALLAGPRRRSRAPDVGAVISEVATRLRSGAAVERAWSAAVDRLLGPPVGPAPGRALPESATGTPDPLPEGLLRLAERCRGDPVAEAAVRAVTAATRLSRSTGAPLADALDSCARTVVEAERAHDARSVALAGPRSTARILTGLPLLGMLLGAGLGAEPVATALDGGWGTASVACGITLLYVGARWSASLVRAAQDPAAASARRRSWFGGDPGWPPARGRRSGVVS